MILLRACATCGGDVQCRMDIDGIECRCLQCSRPLDLKTAAALIMEQRKTAA
ncbi:MAG: hypothetical protein OXL97_12085 [Chloroflexota bacterium]|nr:hypothetical protein [Chloroflexota bacterium]MDE2884600.1 hypothetical protein [Chloroflexota bacterium]